MDYKASGVDIDAGNEAVRRIRGLARSTFTPAVLSDIGSFGGLFRLEPGRFRDPVLVASADGVGTKLKVAFLANKHTPELRRFASEARLREARVQLARSARQADIDWQVGVRRLQAGSDWALVGSVSMPLGSAAPVAA